MTQPEEQTEEKPKPKEEQEPKESMFPSRTISAADFVLDPKTYKIKAFLSGPSGSGKTQSSTTVPGRKLLIDFDNRAETVIGIPDLEILPCHEPQPRSPRAWERAEVIRKQIVAEVSKGIFPYDALIWDGMTMMGRASLNWALLLDPGRGLGGSPAQQHYGPQMDNLAKFIISTIAFPLHVIYTGHVEYIEEKDTGRSLWLPKVTGKLRTEVANWFSETYYCYREWDSDMNRTRYYWITAGSGRKEFFKSSINSLSRFWDGPIEIDYTKDGPRGFADLLERRFNPKVKEETE